MKYTISDKKKCRVANVTDSSSLLMHMLEPPDWQTPQQSRSSSPSFHIDKTISYGGVCCLVKILQVLVIGVCLYALASFLHPLLASNWSALEEKSSSTPDDNYLRLPRIESSQLPDPPGSNLLDLENFQVKINPDPNICEIDNLLFLIIVHSKIDHFHLRQTIRSTWGGLTELSQWKTKLIFILGESSQVDDSGLHSDYKRSKVNEIVQLEAQKHKDLVVGSFPDLYKNLHYKHILGLRYAWEHCSNAKFFIKADDDAFIDLPGLQAYLGRTLGPLDNPYKGIIGGNVSPEGTKPLRTGKWAVTTEEYPWKHYPPFLGGLAYIMTPDVARNLYRVSHMKNIPKVWVDDVWVTGILRTSLRIHPLYMNARYNYNPEEIWEWLQKANSKLPPPSNFIHLDPSRPEWKETVTRLWKHILLAYNITKIDNNLLHLSDNLSEGFR